MYRTLLLAGHPQSPYKPLDPVGESLRLDQQLEVLLSTALDVGVVLSGEDGDKILRQSRWIQYCELIYDTHNTEANFMTNLHAGLYTVRGEAIALPLQEKPVSFSDIQQLVHLFVKNKESLRGAHLCRLKSTMTHSFLAMVTRRGRQMIKDSEALNCFSDPRLIYKFLEEHRLAETNQETLL
jgi:hypothetical protein